MLYSKCQPTNESFHHYSQGSLELATLNEELSAQLDKMSRGADDDAAARAKLEDKVKELVQQKQAALDECAQNAQVGVKRS